MHASTKDLSYHVALANVGNYGQERGNSQTTEFPEVDGTVILSLEWTELSVMKRLVLSLLRK